MKYLIYGMAGISALILNACGGSSPSETKVSSPEPEFQAPKLSYFDGFDMGRLDSELSKPVRDGQLINVAYLLTKNGETAKSGFYGSRTLDGDDPVTEDTLFRIYSMSKPVTAVAVLMLYEDGRIDLDAPVSNYLPELSKLNVFVGMDVSGKPLLKAAKHPPTVRELLSHTAGFGYGNANADYVNQQLQTKNVVSARDFSVLLKDVASVPLLYQPGEGWAYSIASDLQGALVERVSGLSFDEFLKNRVFQPLEMTSTGFSVAEADLSRLSDITKPDADTGELKLAETPRQRTASEQHTFPSGGAGLISSVRDYDRFTRMLSGRGTLGSVTLLKPETVDIMFTDIASKAGTGAADNRYILKDDLGFGLGIGTITKPTQRRNGAPVGTVYWSGAVGTWFWIDPINHITFIGMTQSEPPQNDIQLVSKDIVYHALLSEPQELR